MKILGIDPSLRSTGFGLVESDQDQFKLVTFGVIRPSTRLPFHQRINEIRTRIEELIVKHEPDEIVIENAFYAKNVKTALTLGQVRGAVLVGIASQQGKLFEYSALEIKKAVTGYGQADKHQVKTMIMMLLQAPEDLPLDASDALAAAYCHSNARRFQQAVAETEDRK